MTARQIAKPKISDANANETFDAIADGFKHTANLSIDSLSQYNSEADWRYGVQSRHLCSFAVEKDSAQQFRRERGVPRTIQSHFVFLLNLVTRMRQALCEISITCEKNQTFALRIQSPNVEQPREFCRQQIKNSIAHMRIFAGGYESGGLVQHDGERWRNVNDFSVHLDVVADVWLHAEVSTGFTVDGDLARCDQFIAMPPRSDTGRGKETIKAHNRDS
jgi:hypothetical protein